MRLSKKSEYGLRALIELTDNYGTAVLRRSELAENQRIPIGFLEGILLTLKHAGIVSSRRGVDGGFQLRQAPETISLGHVIRLLDGPLAPIGCVSHTAFQKCEDCPYVEKPVCPIQHVMGDVRNAIAGILDHYSLADFTRTIRSSRPGKKKTPRKEIRRALFGKNKKLPTGG